MKAHELNLDSVALAELRAKINAELNRVTRTMQQKGLKEGVITAKIKIGMLSGADENGEIHTTAVFDPKITSRIGSSFEDKCVATGGRITVQDDGTVILGQISMDEVMKEQKGA